MDTLTVKVEAAKSGSDRLHLAQLVGQHLRQHLLVDIGVEVLEPETLPRYELKTKRVFDHRVR